MFTALKFPTASKSTIHPCKGGISAPPTIAMTSPAAPNEVSLRRP